MLEECCLILQMAWHDMPCHYCLQKNSINYIELYTVVEETGHDFRLERGATRMTASPLIKSIPLFLVS